MDTNNYVMVAALNLLRQKELGTMPLDAEFTPFDLSALRETPKTGDRFKNDPEDMRLQPERPDALAPSRSRANAFK
jgi:hypothetical protein